MVLRGDMERGTAGREDFEVRAGGQEFCDGWAGFDHLLDIVQNQEDLPHPEFVLECPERRRSGINLYSEGAGNRGDHEARVS